MGLEVYYPADIRNALLAAEQASGAALMAAGQENDALVQIFQEGYRAALTTIALAFGLAPRQEPRLLGSILQYQGEREAAPERSEEKA